MAGALAQLASGAEAQYANGKQLMHEGGIEAQAWAGAPGGKGAPVATVCGASDGGGKGADVLCKGGGEMGNAAELSGVAKVI